MPDWDRIFAENAGGVWRAAYRLLGNTADADECMQEAFVDAVRVNGRETVRDWAALLRRLATARGLDRLRRRQREKAAVSGEGSWDAMPAAGEHPEAPTQREELSICLRRALVQLPRHQAQVFCLRHIEDMSYEDIADLMQVNVNSVGAILFRARERLRALLKDLAVETRK